MKKVFLLFFVPVIALGLACNDENNNKGVLDPGSGSEDTAQASVYYPMKTDAYWVNSYSESVNGVVEDQGDEVVTITGREMVNDREYWKFIYGDGDYYDYARIENNVLYALYPDFWVNKPAVLAKAAGVLDEPFIGEEEPIIDFNSGIGESWTIYENTITTEESSSTFKMIGSFVGTEDVTVPAGTFTDCRKFHHDWIYTYSAGDSTTIYNMLTTYWLAANVGVVKTMEIDDSWEEGVFEYTSVLKEYNIP